MDVLFTRVVTPEILEAGELGGEEIESAGFIARIADQPIGQSLSYIFKSCGRSEFGGSVKMEDNPYYHLYKRFNLWLIPHGVGIIRRMGTREVVSVGIEVDYITEGRTCSIRGLVPSPRYVTHGNINIGTSVTGALTANGEIRTEENKIPEESVTQNFLGLQFGIAAESLLELRFRANVVTPKISAVGYFSSKCEWRFEKDAEPLFGTDIQAWAIVALHKRQTSICYRTRAYFDEKLAFFTKRHETDWIEQKCSLELL